MSYLSVTKSRTTNSSDNMSASSGSQGASMNQRLNKEERDLLLQDLTVGSTGQFDPFLYDSGKVRQWEGISDAQLGLDGKTTGADKLKNDPDGKFSGKDPFEDWLRTTHRHEQFWNIGKR